MNRTNLKINKIANRNLTDKEMNILSGGAECGSEFCQAQDYGPGYDWTMDWLYENLQAASRYIQENDHRV